jgi:hypothetical protein
MAEQDRSLITEDRVTHTYYNKRGERVFEVSQANREWDENGAELTEVVQEHLETAGGHTVDAPAPGERGRQPAKLQTCDICEQENRLSLLGRRPPRMTMAPADTMKRCINCRAVLCEDHSITSRFDHQVRCRRCHRWHWLYTRVFERILFVQKGG